MPVKPTIKTIDPELSPQQRATTVVNGAISDTPSLQGLNKIKSIHDLKDFGQIIANNNKLATDFLNTMVGRIARHIITSKTWEGPLTPFFKGDVPLGDTIEESFINPVKPIIFDDPEIPDERTIAKWENEIYTTFYKLNYELTFPQTIETLKLGQYFLSWEGVDNLIAKMTESMYTGANVAIFQTMLYLVARNLLDGKFYVKNIGDYENNPDSTTIEIKTISSDLLVIGNEYNLAGVETFTPYEDQYILTTSRFDATQNVAVLAKAFNINNVEFTGHQIIIGGFDRLNYNYLDRIFKYDPTYRHFTDDEVSLLKNGLAAVMIDRDWFQVYQINRSFEENINALKAFWNYFFHDRRIVATSPFANAIAYVNQGGSVTGITFEQDTFTLRAGQVVALKANATGTGFFNGKVTYTSNNENVRVSTMGIVYVLYGATGTATITATSVMDPSVTATATITIV